MLYVIVLVFLIGLYSLPMISDAMELKRKKQLRIELAAHLLKNRALLK